MAEAIGGIRSFPARAWPQVGPYLTAPATTPAINLAAAPPPARPAQEGFYF